MRCSNCEHEVGPQARFCEECGARLERACSSCGQPLSPTAKFCAHCGANQTESSPSKPPDVAASSPGARALSTGERRQATVLFSDLSGYTAMNERLDPEEVRGIVGRIKAEAVRIVEGHGGIVNQFVGDEVVALFGIPTAHEDDATRAVRAARDLHDMVRAVGPEVEKKIGAPLRLHSGISTGLIVTSTDDRRDGTFGVTGDAVNTGARLASHAETDTVLVSEETQRAIADFFQVEALPAVELKGKAGRVTPYRVIEQTGISSRFEAAAQRGFTAYAGREAELRALQEALREARAGQGQFVTVMGEPGIGKSRLLFEFRHSVPREQATVLTGYCQSYGTDTPYLPLVDALRRGLRMEEAHGANALHDHAVAAVRAISPALERYLPQVLHLLSIPSEQHKIPATLQGDALRRSFEEALAAVMTENARRQPMVLILEDWHWADEASDSALKHLSGLVAHHPLMVVLTYRPDYQRKWANPRHYAPLVLQPLAEDGTAAMLRAVWKAETLPEGLAGQIHARTGGNALFNEEVARGLAGDCVVRVEHGRAVLAGTLENLHLPDSVHAVIRARVDRLDAEPREVLRLASVIGREFALPLLETLYPTPQGISSALEVLAGQDLIHPLRVVPEPAYLFKHALVQDVVYDTLLLSRRKTLHEQTGAAIEALYADRLEEHYEALAGHYGKTDNMEKAVEYLEKAGDKALKVSSIPEARNSFRQAYHYLLSDLAGDDVDWRARSRIAAKWWEASTGQPDSSVYDTLIKLANEVAVSGDPDVMGTAWTACGHAHFLMGNHTDASIVLEKVVGLSARFSDRRPLIMAHSALGLMSYWGYRLNRTFDHVRSLEPLLDVVPDTSSRIWALLGLGIHGLCLANQGQFDSAMRYLEQARSLANNLGIESISSWITNWRAIHQTLKGNWSNAVSIAAQSEQATLKTGDVFITAFARLIGGYSLFHEIQPTRGLALAEAALAIYPVNMSDLCLSWFYGVLSELNALSDHKETARKYLELAEGHLNRGDRYGTGAVCKATAVIMCHNFPASSRALDSCLEIAVEENDQPLQSQAHFRYAEILHKKGDLPAALEQLAQAEKLFAEMEMTWWSEQAAGLRARIESGLPFVWFAPYVDGPPKLDS